MVAECRFGTSESQQIPHVGGYQVKGFVLKGVGDVEQGKWVALQRGFVTPVQGAQLVYLFCPEVLCSYNVEYHCGIAFGIVLAEIWAVAWVAICTAKMRSYFNIVAKCHTND